MTLRIFVKKITLKDREKKPLKGGRQSIIWLFLAVLFTATIFYLKKDLLVKPLVLGDIYPGKKFDPTPILSEIQILTKDLSGSYGVYVYQLDNGLEYGLHQDEIFPAVSLLKLPTMLAIYQEAEKNNLSLDAQYVLADKDKVTDGAGILWEQPTGTIYAYRQLVESMGQFSDRTAFNVIKGILGVEKIEQTIKNLGMNKTSLNKDETSPKDIGLFFKKLYQGGIVTNKHRDEILKFLTKTAFEDGIPAGIPQEIRVAHKFGTDLGTFSDGGIIFGQKPFVLVIMSKDVNESQATDVLPKITKAVWEWETHNVF